MKKYNLDYKRSFPYFIDHIDWGKTLSKTIIQNIPFVNGAFFVILPEEINEPMLYNLSSGGILLSEGLQISEDGRGDWECIDSTSDELAKFIRDFLEVSNDRYAIGEEINFDVGDEVIKRRNLNILTKQKEIYYLLTGESSQDEIDDVVDFTDATYHMILLLGIGNQSFPQELQQEDFTRMAEEAKYIIGSAYDRESYIIWEKSLI